MFKVEREIVQQLITNKKHYVWPDSDVPIICCSCRRTVRRNTLYQQNPDKSGSDETKECHAKKCSRETGVPYQRITEESEIDQHAVNVM
jgi:hypothetical protein